MEQETSEKGRIFSNSVSEILDVNSYGYGSGYGQDIWEVIFNKVDIDRGSDCEERAKFIVFHSTLLRAKSLKLSIEEVKGKAFESWIRLFCLVTSAGSEGVAMSTLSSFTPNFTVKQLKAAKVVSDQEQLALFYPNYEIEFVTGFVQVFAQRKKAVAADCQP